MKPTYIREMQYKKIVALRSKTLKESNYICLYCHKSGTEKNMGIGPDKTKEVYTVIPLHIFCNPPYYGVPNE